MLPRVSQYMDTSVHALRPDTEIFEAVAFLLEHKLTGAPVVNEAQEVIGILSEKDCLNLLALGDGSQRPSGSVSDFMSTPVTTIPPTMNIYFVAGMFLNDVVRRFPVVEDGKLVGAITRFDILRAIKAQLL